jgi:hypothetical protein
VERISDEQWARCSGIAAAGRAFVQRWLELFHVLTIDTYRVRHLNLRLAIEELVAVISDVERFGIDVINVKEVAAEVFRFLKEDSVAATILPNRERYYATLVNPLIENRTVHPGLQVLAERLKAVLNEQYRPALIAALHESIDAGDIPRTLQITASLGTDLIGTGYDLRHLMWRGETFFYEPASPFTEKFETVLGALHPPILQPYTTIFRLDFNSARAAADMPAAVQTFTVAAIVPEATTAPAQQLTHPGARLRFARCTVNTLDPFAAARTSGPGMSAALDLVQFTRPGIAVRLIPTCLVFGPADLQVTVPITLELLGPIRVARDELDARFAQVNAINQNGNIRGATKDRIALGLQYLRRGLTDTTVQSQFLNLWIGFETFLAGGGRGSITEMRRFASRLIALGYPRRLIADLRSNLKRLQTDLGPALNETVLADANPTQAMVALCQALTTQATRDAIVQAAQSSPLLQHRIVTVSDVLMTKQRVREAIERNEQDVLWHVQRMYRLRNAIVHGGYIPQDLTHVGSHLATYLWAILRVAIGELADDPGLRDLKNVFEKYAWLYEEQGRQLSQAPQTLPHFEGLVRPQLYWP